MKIYCFKCKKKTETMNLHKEMAVNGKGMLKGKCSSCGTTKCGFTSDSQKGDGVIGDAIKKVGDKLKEIFGINRAPKSVASFINSHADWTIQSAVVFRKPIQSAIKASIDFIRKLTGAELNKNYDTLYHLGVNLTLKGPKGESGTWAFQRNQTFNIGPSESGGEKKSAAISGNVTVGKLFESLLKSDSNFYEYNATTRNCQDAIIDILKVLHNSDAGVKSFVKQDLKDLLPDIVGKAAKIVTDIANGAEKVLGGNGKKKRKSQKKRTQKRT